MLPNGAPKLPQQSACASWRRRRGGRALRRLSLMAPLVALVAAFGAGSAYATVDSGIAPAESITLPGGHGLYFYLGSTSGEVPMGSISWQEGQDLAVDTAGSSDQAISIGHGASDSGSYGSAAAREAIAAVGLDGYTIVQSFSNQTSKAAHKATHQPEKPIRGASLTLSFKTTEADQLVLIFVGGQGTGTLEASGIEATTLQDATYATPYTDVIASAAAYTATLPAGKHKVKWRSTTYAPNSGTSLGAVVYVLAPAPAPAVASVSPSTGPEAGGTPVTITGTNLDGATSVKFGSTGAESFKVLSPTSIEAVSPNGSGTAEVTVTTERGTSTASADDQFSYLPPPSVSGVSPNNGPEAGGTAVTISGANLSGTTAVKFAGSNAESFKVDSPTSIEAVSPSGSGTVQVTVTNPYGTSATTSSDQFTYNPPPPPPPPSITAEKGGPFRGGYELDAQVHNFPLGTFIYSCHDNSGPGGSEVVYFSHAVEVTNPNQSTWPGVFCYDSAPYVSYLEMDGVRSNSVQF
jgi:hypothetical protein